MCSVTNSMDRSGLHTKWAYTLLDNKLLSYHTVIYIYIYTSLCKILSDDICVSYGTSSCLVLMMLKIQIF